MDEVFTIVITNGILENPNYEDSDSIFQIVNRVINIGNYIIVVGDNNAQVITFELDRYNEGIDLSDKTYEIIYFRNSNHESKGTSNGAKGLINFKISDTKIRFSWLLDTMVTYMAGKITFVIKISGTDYQLKTLPKEISVQDSIVTETNPDSNTLNLGDVIYYGTNTPNSTALLWLDKNIVKLKNTLGEWVNITELQGGGGTIETESSLYILDQSSIKGTTQSIIWNTDDTIQQIKHIKTDDNTTIRTDTFTYNGDTITEVRTINTGETLTFVYHMDTYITETF